MKRTTNHKAGRVVGTVLSILALGLGLVCIFAAGWYVGTYGDIGFDSIVYTLLSANRGTQSDLVNNYLRYGLLPALIWWVQLSVLLFFVSKRKVVLTLFKRFRLRLFPFPRKFSCILSVVSCVVLMFVAAYVSGIADYVQALAVQSTFFDEEYVDPDHVSITFPEEKRNLVYIVLESMETSYLSGDLGGATENNLIPELYTLANEHLNFSQTEGVGGYRPITGTTWTIASLVAQTAGVPLKTPPDIGGNSYGLNDSEFLPGITTLSDILRDNGYYQAYMVGSDCDFGGRRQYYEQHGTDVIYDLFTARKDGIIPSDYFVWWGMEDKYLFEYAKQELTEIAARDEPFAFTMLTVDTHHVGGYRCDQCGTAYGEQYENVIACSSAQVSAFVSWIQQQDFYDNTTVVIVGDHLSMDSGYFNRNVDEEYVRRVYNCFINAAADTDHAKNREFSTVDLFPTVLSSIGCEIEGDRLGLGTNLFSDRLTMVEEIGYEAFDELSSQSSAYYMGQFFFAR